MFVFILFNAWMRLHSTEKWANVEVEIPSWQHINISNIYNRGNYHYMMADMIIHRVHQRIGTYRHLQTPTETISQAIVGGVFFLKQQEISQYPSGKRVGERNVLFNDALNTFYLRLYGIRHMVKDHSDSEKGNPLLPHRLLLSINSKGSFICTIPQTG